MLYVDALLLVHELQKCNASDVNRLVLNTGWGKSRLILVVVPMENNAIVNK